MSHAIFLCSIVGNSFMICVTFCRCVTCQNISHDATLLNTFECHGIITYSKQTLSGFMITGDMLVYVPHNYFDTLILNSFSTVYNLRLLLFNEPGVCDPTLLTQRPIVNVSFPFTITCIIAS